MSACAPHEIRRCRSLHWKYSRARRPPPWSKQGCRLSMPPTMRQERTVQASIFDVFAGHEIGRELKAMSRMAGRASRSARPGGARPAPGRRQGDRTARPAGGGGAALRAAQAVPPAELRGVGVPSRGLRLVSGLCPPAMVVEPEEVGAAKDDQRDPGRDLGSDQSDAAVRAPGRRSSKTARSCGWTARSPRRSCTSRATAACCGMRCG